MNNPFEDSMQDIMNLTLGSDVSTDMCWEGADEGSVLVSVKHPLRAEKIQKEKNILEYPYHPSLFLACRNSELEFPHLSENSLCFYYLS